MNKLVFALLISLTSFSFSQMNAQQFQVGVKGGINKTSGGQITGIDSGLPLQYTSDTFEAVGNIGYHGGGWVQVNFGKFFIRPELVYSNLESTFEFQNYDALYNIEELSVPVLVGYNVYGPLDLYVGAAYKNIIDVSLFGLEDVPNATPPSGLVVQNTPFSAQIGAKAQFGIIGVDVRYDYSLSSEEKQNLDFFNGGNFGINKATFDDPRLNQLIVSLTLKLWDSENKGKRRRKGGSCYF
ncbi:outer membrane protein with beta-barrel domain [Gillisia sp. Hel_I_86]|uniref:outer membrane beta-barrel protein n=1 Tax=Gillisia sp. Hel_I_86 TaxID=1249981 RepID=UPI00119A4045|nr:outer membrane beta-barrel protein [Gillisia sp. Hel_I_86]TVZ27435.1 outer membrane protein with beta-barrel domain [Gillisia sp. Hel_I_86]